MKGVPHRGDIVRPDVAKKLNSIVQRMLLAHLLELDHLWPVAADDKAHAGKDSADMRRRGDEQVDAFAVDKAGDDNNGDWRATEL